MGCLMIRIKKILTICISLIIICVAYVLFNPLSVIADEPIGLVINGRALTDLPVHPVIRQNHVLVPIRVVFEELGATVEWQGESRTVYIHIQNSTIIIPIGRSEVIVNGDIKEMPVPSTSVNGSTMMPLYAVTASVGMPVNFINQTVYIGNDPIVGISSLPIIPLPIIPLPTIPLPTIPLPTILLPTVPSPINNANQQPSTLARDVSEAGIPPAAFPQTRILSVSIPAATDPQVFVITASAPISAVERMLLNDNRLVLDFTNSLTDLNGAFAVPAYSPVNGLRASQFTADTSRVVFDLPDGAAFSIGISDDRVKVMLTIYCDAERDKNYVSTDCDEIDIYTISYILLASPSNIFRIPKANGFNMDIGQITHLNLYHNNQYIITFPAEPSPYLEMGAFAISSALLDSYTVGQDEYGYVQLSLYGTQILAVRIYEDDTYYVIHVLCPREKYDRIVVIDPGDGGRHPGAIHFGVYERDLNLAVALKVQTLLSANDSIQVYTTRNSDVTVYIADRIQFGNAIGDLFVSIHHNAFHNPGVHGVESFYAVTGLDASRTLTSQHLAGIMQRYLTALTERHNRGYRMNNGFLILRYATIPAVLVEVGFMSNPRELADMITTEYQWRAALAIYAGIREAFMMYTPERTGGLQAA